MIPKYSLEQFDQTKSRGTLTLECERCHQDFQLVKYTVVKIIKGQGASLGCFCSRSCAAGHPAIIKQCTTCGKEFVREQKEVNKSIRHFCSHSCNATFYNKNKTTGTRRSKLEKWLEEQLMVKHPTWDIHFNQKGTINSELDIYIPALRLAFELNGIFHYEPIYGEQKLSQIQNNDHRKFQACAEQSISLCIIDSSAQKHFTVKSSVKYLDIIESIISRNIGDSNSCRTGDNRTS